MPLDPSLLYPTFLNLIHLADPRNWLSQLLPSILYNTINLSGASGRSNHPKALTERAGDDDVDSEDDPELTPEQREERKRQRRQDRETERWLLGEREKDNCSSDEGDKDELDDIMTQLKDYDTEDSVRSHRSDTVSSATSQNTIHGRQRSSSSAQNHERSTTPTQSNTLAHAKDQERPKLDPSDLGSLTAEQIAQLQANMLEDIQDADSRPLVSTVQPMEVLMAEYSTNPNFLKKMEWLKKQNWLGYRRTKGDGDCFYRSFAFAWVERILRARDRELAVAAGVSTLHTTFLSLGEVGFDTMVFEDFYEVLKSLVVQIVTPEPDGQTLNASLLLEAFTSPEASNSIVSYMRMITSAELRKNAPEYEAFILHPDTQEPMPVADFCSMFVEGMGKEADHVQMQALAKTMGVNLSVAYLDGSAGTSEDGSVDFVKFENGGGNEANGIDDVVLLYRPGHYDILEHRAHEHRPSAASALVTPSVME